MSAKARAGTQHVIWDNREAPPLLTLAPEEQLVLRCLHCGDRYVMALPASLSMTSAVCKQYGREHRHCKPMSPP